MLTKEEANAAANIERLMLDQELSFRELAKRANVNYNTVHAFVNGRHSPRLGFVQALANVLGVGVDELMKTPRKREQRVGV